MKLPQVIKGGLASVPRKLAQRQQPEIQRIDIDQIAKELDLENEAKKLADAGLPTVDQTVLTLPEGKAVQRVEKARRDFSAWASTRLEALNRDLARRDVA